ncbi:TIGR04282 family arsenosugar biosynthesis glycosyltransferase [Flagellimonas algicola]|uniref:TIGR04282 family arsenosugar biosynthesis glycosyltransferase n=1 Tax=Flagellimonas algicola TaxID=2583815 RepID=UPI001386E3A9|nr:DUF2064 domain-containing protein [Allomuricauda algicola]
MLFANSAEEDIRAKKLHADSGLLESLNQHVIKVIEATDLPHFHFSEKEQVGNSFGKRFVNAIQAIFDKGYLNVIAIGNDSPHLGKHHIQEASKLLLQKKVVLGPSLDGGFYLLGITREHFDANGLESLPWQTSNLYQDTLAYFDSVACQLATLETLSDIDSIIDIKHLSNFAKTLSKNWLSLFSKMLKTKHRFISTIEISPEILSRQNPFNKGSPVRFTQLY